MPGPLGDKSYMLYVSDDGNNYNVITLLAHVTASGGTETAEGDHPTLPIGYHPRHVWGEQTDGTRVKLVIGSASNSLFVSGGTFSLFGGSYKVEGKIGERRLVKKR